MDILFLISLIHGAVTLVLLRRYYRIFLTECRFSGAVEWLCYGLTLLITVAISLLAGEHIPLKVGCKTLHLYTLTYIYNGSQKTRILLPVTFMAVLSIFEIALSYLMFSFTFDITVVQNDVIFNIAAPLYSTIFSYIYILIAEKIKNKNTGVRFSAKDWGCVIFIPMSTLLINLIAMSIPNVSTWILSLCTMLLLFLNLVSFYFYEITASTISNKIRMELIEERNHYYAEQLKTLTSMSESLRSYQYNLKKHVHVIESYIDEGKYDKMREYYYKTMHRPLLERREFQTGNTIIDSLLNYKSIEAARKGITLEVSVKVPPSFQIHTSTIMLIFGNLLDNAIEAASQAENKSVSINITYAQHCLMLQIQNHYSGELKKKGKNFISTKENTALHGYDLRNVRRIVEECDGTISLDHSNNIFTAKVLLNDTKNNIKSNQAEIDT